MRHKMPLRNELTFYILNVEYNCVSIFVIINMGGISQASVVDFPF
jgi:hypothetical protein